MNIDERLDRLTERHEALTQSVELMAHAQDEDHRKNQVLVVQTWKASMIYRASVSRGSRARERRISDLETGRE